MNIKLFVEIMESAYVLYNKKMDADGKKLIELYWEYFKRFDMSLVAKAFIEYTATDEKCEFFPKPGQIIKLITGNEKSENMHDAQEKWAELIENIKRGHHEILDDSVYIAVRQIGGSRAIGMIDEDRLDWKKREFIERYLDILDRKKRKLMINASNSEKDVLKHIG